MVKSKKLRLWAMVAFLSVFMLSIPLAMAEPGHQPEMLTVSVAKQIADQYLKEHASSYHLKSDLSELKYSTTITTPLADYVRYQQVIGNHPVFTNQVVVTVSRAGKVQLVVSDFKPAREVQKIPSKQISQEERTDRAFEQIGAKDKETWGPTKQEFGYLVQDGQAIPVYRVVVHSVNPFGAWETYLRAGDGKLLAKRDLNRHATGSGKVFLPNPVETARSVSGLSDRNDADSPALDAQLKPVILQGLDGSGNLKGQFVNIQSRSKTFSQTLTFNYTRNQNSFEDVMAYYHLDTIIRYIHGLGFTNVMNGTITANVDTYKEDNSFYSPTKKDLTFGTGGVDDAEDAGVIVHELGHAIQDNQVPGFGNSEEGGAMGEGFGDYMGATYEDALTQDDFGKACVAEWDSTAYSSGNPPCLRRLDTNKVYPDDLQGEVHADGEIWSQGLYEMAQAFGRDVATKIILQSHWSLTPNATFHDGAKAIKQADVILFGGMHGAKIDQIWAARGISTQ